MQTGCYRFICRFVTPAFLPAFKGSTLRGAFGHALKRVACALRRQPCEACLLHDTCSYSFIFEVSKTLPENGNGQPRIAARPHPFVLDPPLTSQRSYAADDSLEFGLTLFGRANDYLPHIVYAVEQMGEAGLGKGAGEELGKFQLVAVHSNDIAIYDGARKVLAQNFPVPRLILEPAPLEPVTSLIVNLLTPLRLKYLNQLQETLPFHVLIRAALRRIASLTEAYGDGEPDLDYAGLVRRAEKVETRHSDCHWLDLRRYSNRQKSEMLVGGVQGRMEYSGELAEFLSLLRYCEITRLGKQTAFGLGGLRWRGNGGWHRT